MTDKPDDNALKPRQKRKLNAQIQSEICGMIAAGCSRRTAARLVRCSPQAIAKLAKANPAFGERLRRAEQQREVVPLNNIVNASRTRWRAGAWFLERVNPGEYGRHDPEALTPQAMKDISQFVLEVISRALRHSEDFERVQKALDAVADYLSTLDHFGHERPPRPPRLEPLEGASPANQVVHHGNQEVA